MTKETPGVPEQQTATESPVKQIVNFLSSMQLGIILLLLLAVISLFATFRPMELAIENVYTSWWFVGIMAFTALNLLLCTVERMGPLTRQAMQPKKVATADGIRKMQLNTAIKLQDEPLAKAETAFKKVGLQTEVTETPDGPVVFGEKGKFGYFGSIVTHLSLLLILLGAMYGSLTGFEARNGGYAGGGFFVPEGNFRVDITNVKMVLEDDPKVRPRVYTDMTITRGGQIIKQDTISINDPIRFEGTTIYHSTFLYLPEITVKDPATGQQQDGKFFEGDRISLDNQGTYVQIMQFFPNFSMRMDGTPFTRDYSPNNPVAAGIMVRGGQRVGTVFLELNKPQVLESAQGDVEVLLTGFDVAAVFSIAKNLGRPYLFIGSVLMILGLYMSFFLFPRRFWAVYDERKGTLLIGGRGYRNRLGIEQALERIESEILSREEE